MAKEEYETPLIDVYNRTHMDALHEDGAWYHRFLPEGVFLEDLGQIVEEELIKAYNEVEREADEFFDGRVKNDLRKYLHRQIQKILEDYCQRNLLLHGRNCLLKFKERFKSCMILVKPKGLQREH